jgi:activator of HSP90 ATPase
MSERENSGALANALTRRQVLASVAIALSAVAAGSATWAKAQQPAKKEAPSTTASDARSALHQELDFHASPKRIYEVLLDSKQFAVLTGMPADIDAKAGGAFSMFGGMIVGRNIELVPQARVVQAWRPTHWDAGVYSLVKFELKEKGGGTLLVLDHSSFPAGDYESLYEGWGARYWEPLKKFIA